MSVENIRIDKGKLAESNITLAEYLSLIILKTGNDIHNVMDSLAKKGFASYRMSVTDGLPHWTISKKGSTTLKSLNVVSSSMAKDYTEKSCDYASLAQRLLDVYPHGRRENSQYRYTEGLTATATRLKKWRELFDSNNSYSDNDIAEATKRYVESFNNDFTYIKSLKYWLFKADIEDGVSTMTSMLLTALETKGEAHTAVRSEDWGAVIN